MDSKILGATVASLAMVVASAGAAWSMMTSSPADQSTASEAVTYVTEKSLAPATALPAHLNIGPAPAAATTTTTTAAPAPTFAPQPVYVPPPTQAPQPVVTAPPATAPQTQPPRESTNEIDD